MFEFKKIKVEDRKTLGKFIEKYGFSYSDHCFGGLYIWQDAYNTEYSVYDNTVIIRGNIDGKRFYQAPVGENFDKAIEYLIHNDSENLCFLAISQHEKERIESVFPDKFRFEFDRDNSDYIYSRQDLSFFKGKSFQQKRNHVNKFIRLYGKPEVISLNKYNIGLIAEAEEHWLYENDSDNDWLIREKKSIKRCIESFDSLEFLGNALMVNDEIVAFGIGERLGKDMVLQHFEKASRKYEGCYAVMTSEFAKSLPDDIVYINREEDMGIEGLRQAKLSLKPIRLEEKYNGFFVK